MSNVIRWRQLSNSQKLTPKTDFIYTNPGGSENRVYNLDMSVKIDPITNSGFSKGHYTSIGRGEAIITEYSTSSGFVRLGLTGKGTNTRLKTLGIDVGKTYPSEDIVFCFLGQPFLSSGNTDRYGVSSYSTDGTNYYVALINLDEWSFTLSNDTTGSPGQHPHSFTYDGEKVYFCEGNGALRIFDINTKNQALVQDSDTGNFIFVRHIYGIADGYLWMRTKEGYRAYLQFSSNNYTATTTVINNTVCFDKNTLYSEGGTIRFIGGSGLNSNAGITQSLVDAAVIGSGEGGLVPLLVLDYTLNGDEIKFTWVLKRNDTGYVERVKTTINDSTGAVSTERVGIGVNIGSPTTLLGLRVAFANTCNSYNIGKFSNYGLQKQWNNR